MCVLGHTLKKSLLLLDIISNMFYALIVSSTISSSRFFKLKKRALFTSVAGLTVMNEKSATQGTFAKSKPLKNSIEF